MKGSAPLPTIRRHCVNAAIRRFRALDPGESASVIVFNAAVRTCEPVFSTSLRISATLEPSGFGFHVTLEEFERGDWRAYNDHPGQCYNPFDTLVRPDALRTLVEFYAWEADGVAEALIQGRMEDRDHDAANAKVAA